MFTIWHATKLQFIILFPPSHKKILTVHCSPRVRASETAVPRHVRRLLPRWPLPGAPRAPRPPHPQLWEEEEGHPRVPALPLQLQALREQRHRQLHSVLARGHFTALERGKGKCASLLILLAHLMVTSNLFTI